MQESGCEARASEAEEQKTAELDPSDRNTVRVNNPKAQVTKAITELGNSAVRDQGQ